MNLEDKNSLFSTMDKYPDVVNSIIKEQWYYRLHLVESYIITPLQNWCTENGFNWYEDENFRSQGKYTGFGIYRPEWKKQIAIDFDRSDFRDAYYGIWDPIGRGKNESILLGDRNNNNWPYGWKDFDKFSSWGIDIAKEIISGEVLRYIIGKIEDLLHDLSEFSDKYPMD